MTFKILLLLLPLVAVALFAAAYVMTNFIVYETFGKIKETEFKLNKETDIKSGECENYKISAGVQVGINEEIPNEALVTLTFQIGEIEEQQVKSLEKQLQLVV